MDGGVAAERAVLGACLDDARAAVVSTLGGVPAALLREPLVSNEGSLLAIVKHLAHLERWWFAHTVAGLDVVFPWSDETPMPTGGSIGPTRPGESWRSTTPNAGGADSSSPGPVSTTSPLDHRWAGAGSASDGSCCA